MKLFDKLALAAWAGLAGWALALKLGWVAWATTQTPSLCLFKFWWGVPCPGCGMGHALLRAFLWQWGESVREHPLGLPVLFFWTAWAVFGAANLRRGKPFSADFPLALQGSFSTAALLAALLGTYFLKLAGMC